MAERRELVLPRANATSLREQLARTTLNTVRSQGHVYVDLRENGKRFIFFCTLCLAPCYSDSVLLDHLKGNLHKERLSAAKLTLFQQNPWPFSDGVLFFGNSTDEQKQLALTNGSASGVSEFCDSDDNLAILKYVDGAQTKGKVCKSKRKVGMKGLKYEIVVPHVLIRERTSDLKVQYSGVGRIAARICEKDGVSNGIKRIWCEWLGDMSLRSGDKIKATKHEFAIITFPFNCSLGRKGLLDDVKLLPASCSSTELENSEGNNRKRKRSFSDPEDVSDSLSKQYESSGEDSSALNGDSPRLLVDSYDDQLLHTRLISSKLMRRELRRQQRIAAERMCDICQQKMLPGKDVATLLNMKTGKLACSSRNVNGAFHIFHTSCLIHWILLCEVETIRNQAGVRKVRRRTRRQALLKSNGKRTGGVVIRPTGNQISCVLCPECQGTGQHIDGDELESPNITLAQIFRYKIKVSDARREWMKSPELLENCSIGFHFPSESEEKVEVFEFICKSPHFDCSLKRTLFISRFDDLVTGKGVIAQNVAILCCQPVGV